MVGCQLIMLLQFYTNSNTKRRVWFRCALVPTAL
jgi:hypothetical protein